MIPSKILFCLFAFLPLFDGKVLNGATSKLKNREAIINAHNKFRGQVYPAASDMKRMVNNRREKELLAISLQRNATSRTRDLLVLVNEWSTEAAKNANKFAKKCILDHSPFSERKISSPSKMNCGENIYYASEEKDWEHVIHTWYSENENFIYGHGPKSSSDMVGHYTQVVWSNTFLCGCAVEYCPQNRFSYFYVCQYCPAGNNWDTMKTPYKKGKSCGTCPHTCDENLCM